MRKPFVNKIRPAWWILLPVCCVGLLLGASTDRVLFASDSAEISRYVFMCWQIAMRRTTNNSN